MLWYLIDKNDKTKVLSFPYEKQITALTPLKLF